MVDDAGAPDDVVDPDPLDAEPLLEVALHEAHLRAQLSRRSTKPPYEGSPSSNRVTAAAPAASARNATSPWSWNSPPTSANERPGACSSMKRWRSASHSPADGLPTRRRRRFTKTHASLASDTVRNLKPRGGAGAGRDRLRHPPAPGAPTDPDACLERLAGGPDHSRRRLLRARGPGRDRVRSGRRSAAVHGNVDGPSCASACPSSWSWTWRASAWRWSTTPGPAKGRLARMRRRFPRGGRGGLRPLAHPAARARRTASRSSTPAARPSAAAPRTTPWGWPRWQAAGPCSPSSNWTRFAAPWTSTSLFVGTAGSAPSARRSLPATLVRRGGERLLSTAARAPSASSPARSGWSSWRTSSSPTSTPTTCSACPGMVKTFNLRGRERRSPSTARRGWSACSRSSRPLIGRDRLRAAPRRARATARSSSATATGSPPSTSTTACPPGYALLEDEPPGALRRGARARARASSPGPDFGRLQRGETVGGGDARPGARRGARGAQARPHRRHRALASWSAPWPTGRPAGPRGHASPTRTPSARPRPGHSTAREAAALAAEAEVKLLALTHLSRALPGARGARRGPRGVRGHGRPRRLRHRRAPVARAR